MRKRERGGGREGGRERTKRGGGWRERARGGEREGRERGVRERGVRERGGRERGERKGEGTAGQREREREREGERGRGIEGREKSGREEREERGRLVENMAFNKEVVDNKHDLRVCDINKINMGGNDERRRR